MKEKRRVDRWWHVALYWCSIETRWKKKTRSDWLIRFTLLDMLLSETAGNIAICS